MDREDCISREWVLNLYKEWQPTLATNVYEFGEALKNAPSVIPKEMTGEWEHYIDRNGIPWERCSECGDSTLSVDRENINFCPNCGAYMRGEENEPALTRKEKDFLATIRHKPDEIFLYRVEGNNLLVQTLYSDLKFYIDPNMFSFIKEGSGMSFERLCELRMVGDDDRVGE